MSVILFGNECRAEPFSGVQLNAAYKNFAQESPATWYSALLEYWAFKNPELTNPDNDLRNLVRNMLVKNPSSSTCVSFCIDGFDENVLGSEITGDKNKYLDYGGDLHYLAATIDFHEKRKLKRADPSITHSEYFRKKRNIEEASFRDQYDELYPDVTCNPVFYGNGDTLAGNLKMRSAHILQNNKDARLILVGMGMDCDHSPVIRNIVSSMIKQFCSVEASGNVELVWIGTPSIEMPVTTNPGLSRGIVVKQLNHIMGKRHTLMNPDMIFFDKNAFFAPKRPSSGTTEFVGAIIQPTSSDSWDELIDNSEPLYNNSSYASEYDYNTEMKPLMQNMREMDVNAS